jgi:Coenzyme PQQ synthesis protein D (PqqD)
MTEEQRIALKVDDLTWREVQDELLVLDMATTTYLTLNGSAKFLWEQLVDGATLTELAGSLVDRYGIDTGRARVDAEEFLQVLEERSFVKPA